MQTHRNRALLESVRAHVMNDQRLAGQIINITASEGDIEVTGIIDTEDNRQLALALAAGVIGVHSVKDHIDVHSFCCSDR